LRLTDRQGAPQDHHIVFFPPGLQALRLDLPSVPAHSSIEALSVHGTEITKQEATLLSLWQHRSAVNTRPQALGAKGVRLAKYCYKHGLRATIERLEQGLSDWMNNYQAWAALNGALSEADEAAIRAHIGHFRARPTFSILMPVYNTEAKILKEAIASVRSQLYPHWQLCIVDDASDAPHVAEILAAAAQADARICVRRRQQNGHICRASNDALDMAQGEFVVLFDHDDLLTPHALYLLAHELEAHPEAQILYSDEDKISQEQGRYSPYFKHDFDPDLLLGQNCVSHLGCYKTARVRAIGGFRVGYEGSQDHDLVLRASAGLPHTAIRHIPQVLYHWRAIEGSTATAATAKSYAQTAGLRAVQDHLNRQGTGAKACPTADPGLYRIRYPVPEPRPLVSVIIPTRDRVDLLRQCIDSLRQQTDYAPLEILVVDNDSTCAKTLAYLKLLAGEPDVQIIRAPGPFNYAAINNRAAALAKGDILCLLNNDIEAIEPGWLTEMVSHVLRPDVGVVGARLLYPDGKTIQHGGVILGVGGIASHAFQRETLSSANHFGNDRLVRRYSAVTGACLMVQKSVYEQVGGLDPALKVAYNDIDFCLRVGAKGLGVVWTPFATLLHHESASRGSDTSPDKAQRFAREQQLMQRRYGEVLVADPHYNPNLTLTAENFSLSLAPRYSKPWSPYL
jgi:glycosyltransferase involved in cell wall biosynthesis